MIRGLGGILAAASLALAAPAWAEGTPVGTQITNSASVEYTLGGLPVTTDSNLASLVVHEVVDVDVDWNDGSSVPATSPDLGVPLSFNVINVGNGSEAFELAVEPEPGDDFDPTNYRIYLDDGDGQFNAGADALYVFNGNDPVLASDAAQLVFVVADIPAGRPVGTTGSLRLRATAVTADAGGSAPGTIFPGAGDPGPGGPTDAVIGSRGASESDGGNYQVGEISAELVKSQSVNGANPEPGTPFAAPGDTVTYILTLTVSGEGDLHNARISDAIPPGTSYVANSMTLDAGSGPQSLTDGAGDDEGFLNTGAVPTQVEFQLGSVAAGTSRIATFQVLVD